MKRRIILENFLIISVEYNRGQRAKHFSTWVKRDGCNKNDIRKVHSVSKWDRK